MRSPNPHATASSEFDAPDRTALRDEDIVTEHASASLFRYLPHIPPGCVRHLLHESHIGRVELCTNGTASLVIGGLTLRLPIGNMVALHDLLEEALAVLSHAEHAARAAANRGEDN